MSGSEEARGGSTFVQTARAVAWSFFGVRKRRDLELDQQKLHPVHLIVAGIVGAGLFVAVLLVLIKWVVGSGVAA